MKTETPEENALTNYNQVPLDKILTLRRVRKVRAKTRRITREEVLEDAFTYQIPMEVTQIMKRPNGDRYPVCPRCKMVIDREYVRFCDNCGQRLGWQKLKDAVFVYPGYNALRKKENSVTDIYFQCIYPSRQSKGHGSHKTIKQEEKHTAGVGK